MSLRMKEGRSWILMMMMVKVGGVSAKCHIDHQLGLQRHLSMSLVPELDEDDDDDGGE